MTQGKAYLIGTNIHSFRKDEPGEIIGVKWIMPRGYPARLCCTVR